MQILALAPHTSSVGTQQRLLSAAFEVRILVDVPLTASRQTGKAASLKTRCLWVRLPRGRPTAERASLVIQRSPEERENIVRFDGSAPMMGRGSTGEGSGLISRHTQVRILSPRPIFPRRRTRLGASEARMRGSTPRGEAKPTPLPVDRTRGYEPCCRWFKSIQGRHFAAVTQWAETRLLSEVTGVRILAAAPIHGDQSGQGSRRFAKPDDRASGCDSSSLISANYGRCR